MNLSPFAGKVEEPLQRNDGDLSERSELPSDFTTRRHEICWKYNLDPGEHNIRIKLLNPDLDGSVNMNGILIYDKK